MKTATFSALAAAATLLAATAAHAGLLEEVVIDRETTPVHLVLSPPTPRPFGVPNASEFDANSRAAMDEMRVVPYPKETPGFGSRGL